MLLCMTTRVTESVGIPGVWSQVGTGAGPLT